MALGTKYSIVTPYTAFLVLENEAAYQRFSIERLNAHRTENERSAQDRQRQADSPAQSARDVQWSSPHVPPIRDNGSGGGGAVEWLFLAGLGALAGGRWLDNRKQKREQSSRSG